MSSFVTLEEFLHAKVKGKDLKMWWCFLCRFLVKAIHKIFAQLYTVPIVVLMVSHIQTKSHILQHSCVSIVFTYVEQLKAVS